MKNNNTYDDFINKCLKIYNYKIRQNNIEDNITEKVENDIEFKNIIYCDENTTITSLDTENIDLFVETEPDSIIEVIEQPNNIILNNEVITEELIIIQNLSETVNQVKTKNNEKISDEEKKEKLKEQNRLKKQRQRERQRQSMGEEAFRKMNAEKMSIYRSSK
jgi:hypothetical protein